MKYNFHSTWHRKVLCVHDARMEADRQAGRLLLRLPGAANVTFCKGGRGRPLGREGRKEGRTVGTGIGGPREGGRAYGETARERDKCESAFVGLL